MNALGKLYHIGKLLREQGQAIASIDQFVQAGVCSEGEAFDKTIDLCREYDEKIKAIINEPVKISRKQFMQEQKFHALNIN